MEVKRLLASEKEWLARIPSSSARAELDRVEKQIDALTREKLAVNSQLQYHEALKLVASENPGLDETRTILVRRLF